MFMISHGKQIVIIKSPSGETTLACILPVPLSLGWNQRHVLAHYDVDVQILSEIYGPQHVLVFFMIKTLKNYRYIRSRRVFSVDSNLLANVSISAMPTQKPNEQ